MAEICGQILTVRFQNLENGWCVLRCKEDGATREFIATGKSPPVSVGQKFQFDGDWTKHDEFGWQFIFGKSVEVLPSAKNEIIHYLSSGLFPGIGKKSAEKIVKKFGSATLNRIDEDPDCIFQVKGIHKRKLEDFKDFWIDERINNQSHAFLSKHGFGQNLARKIIDRFGIDTISTLTKDPYSLTYKVRGIGFQKADEMARSFGIEPDDDARVGAGLVYCIKTAEDFGHCYLLEETLKEDINRLLGIEIPEGKFSSCLMDKLEEGVIVEDQGRLYRKSIFYAELLISQKISQMKSDFIMPNKVTIDGWLKTCENDILLSDEQVDAVSCAAQSPVFILTGGPGVGKTTTSNMLIQLLKFLGKKLVVCAPTGRAAQRVSELSGVNAMTIHRVLKYDGTQFFHDSDNPLKCDVVIVDESSMLDINLASALFSAIDSKTQLILIGDVDQLPSVGPGQVLKDLIESDAISYKKLTQIFRQASTSNIVTTAHQINKGITPLLSQETDCKFIEIKDSETIRDVVIELMTETVPKQTDFSRDNDIQILSPMRRGIIGTENINEIIQKKLRGGGDPFSIEDRVIQTVNNYELDVFNGDIGYVRNMTGKEVVVQFGERLIEYPMRNVNELQLAYAITIHKSQGSEFPVVIIPMSHAHHVMLERNLIYTGLTRAKNLCIFVGSKASFKFAIDNIKSHLRLTSLKDKLKVQV